MKTKILLIEHDPDTIKAIQQALKIGCVNCILETVQSEKDFKKAVLNFKPDIILSNYTSPTFDGRTAFALKEKLVPETPFIFISESIGEENAVALIKNGATDFVLKERLGTLADKINCTLEEVTTINLKAEHKLSEEKRTEELSENEFKYQSLVESSMDAILLTVKDGKILAANAAACEIFKMTAEEICGAGRFGLVDSTDSRLPPLLEERNRTGRAKGELTFIRKDGRKFPGEISSVVFTDAYGQEKTSMSIRDITERKETEQKLAQTTADLENALNVLTKILDSSLDLICTVDKEGKFVSVSAASKRIWGYSPDELIGKNYIDFVFPEDAIKTLDTDTNVQSGVQVTMFENRYVHKDGHIVPMLWSSRWDEMDQLSYGIAKDATEKKNLEKAFAIERKWIQDLFLQAPSCMGILKGPNHVYELANDLYLQLIDKKKDIIGKTVKEVLPELEAQGIFEFLDTVYQTGETFLANEMLVKFDFHGNGKLVDTYLNFIYQAHRDSDGTIDGIFFFANDVTEQVLSRKNLEESVLRYSSLIEQASDAICILDTSMKIIDVNAYACQKLGYSKSEVLQLSIGDFFLEEDLKADPLKMDALYEGKTIRGERRIKRKDNTVIDVELSAKILKDESILLFARDITENKKVQQALMESEKKYRFLFENNPMPMWITELNTFKFLDVNKMAILQYGYSREEFLSMTAIDIRPEADKESFRQFNKSFEYEPRNSNRGIWNHQKKNGTIIPVEITAHEVIYEGAPARFILSNDITDRKKSEEALWNSEEKFRNLINYSPVGITLTSEQGEILEVNQTILDITGFEYKEEFINISVSELYIDKNDRKQLMELFKKDGVIKNFETRLKRKNGEIIWVSTNIHPFKLPDGETAILSAIVDITNRRKAELNLENQNIELVKTNAELDRFVYSVSHDLRSPLTSILGLLSFIEEESQEADTLEHTIMIRNSINRLDEFIKNILSYSRNNRIQMEIQQIPIKQTTMDIVESLQSMKEAKGIIYEIDIQEQQPFYSDSLRFNTIMENLISNAIKHHKKSKSGRYIKITGQSDHEKLQFSVADNGIGIALAHHQKIFDMFFRLSGETSGTGIGLYIVKDAVEKMQGTLEVLSEKEIGTTFIITLKNLKK